jgi:hypothetical protein
MLTKCKECSQHWLLAQEERLNDIYVYKRLSGDDAKSILATDQWPSQLHRYEELLEIGQAHGFAARYGEPLGMWPIAVDLLGQRPSLSAADFARLGNIDEESAEQVLLDARRKLEEHGYPYPWRPA